MRTQWPPSHFGRGQDGTRRAKPPPPIEKAGIRAPSPQELGISLEELLQELRTLEGLPPTEIIPRHEWPMHLKTTTMANIPAIVQLPTLHRESKEFLRESLRFLSPDIFHGLVTPRTFRSTLLSWAQVDEYVRAGKAVEVATTEPLPLGQHSVNMWAIPEWKQRVRIINEPALNSCVGKESLGVIRWRSRLERRQRHRRSFYMLQLDFDAYYNSIEIESEQRNCFIFKKDGRYFALTTLATGGRWSVAMGQSITWVIVGVETGATVDTIIDNILIGAERGHEKEFVRTVRLIAQRTQLANLQTTPRADELLAMKDREILALARAPTTFMGEVFTWDETLGERLVTNANKTLAKLQIAARKPAFTKRTFAGFVSLLLFATHTINIDPAKCFFVLNALRSICKAAARDGWDSPVDYLAPQVQTNITELRNELIKNSPVRIERPHKITYNDSDYENVIFIDASGDGWGAIWRSPTTTTTLQRRWINRLEDTGPRRDIPGIYVPPFSAKHSAHAEPTAIIECLRYLDHQGALGQHTAVVTDHFPIVLAQRKGNGYGGIGKGKTLNSLFRLAHELLQTNHRISFFYIQGPLNPADEASRHFGVETHGQITTRTTNDAGLPFLSATFCPLCENDDPPEPWMQ